MSVFGIPGMHNAPKMSVADRGELLQRYEALTPEERAVLQLMAVAYIPVARNKYPQLLRHARIRRRDGTEFEVGDLRKIHVHLIDRGVALQPANAPVLCHPALIEHATRDAVREGTFESYADAVADMLDTSREGDTHQSRSYAEWIAIMRLHLYWGNAELFLRFAKIVSQNRSVLLESFRRIFNDPFDYDWFARLPAGIVACALEPMLRDPNSGVDHASPYEFLRTYFDNHPDDPLDFVFCQLLDEHALLRGDVDALRHLAESRAGTLGGLAAQGIVHLVEGRYAPALDRLNDALALHIRSGGTPKNALPGRWGIFHAVALIRSGSAEELASAERMLRRETRSRESEYRESASKLLNYVEQLMGKFSGRQSEYFASHLYNVDNFQLLLHCLAEYWAESGPPDSAATWLEKRATQSRELEQFWLAAELESILLRRKQLKGKRAAETKAFYERTGLVPLADAMNPADAWERSLTALELVAQTSAKTAGTEESLAWHVRLGEDEVGIEPRIVKPKRNGGWTKGKPVSLSRLIKERDAMPFLTEHDLRVCNHIVNEPDPFGYRSMNRFALSPRALAALAGHPMVFLDGETPLEVVSGTPELHVTQKGDQVRIELNPPVSAEDRIAVVREAVDRIRVVEFTNEHRRIASVVGDGLSLPAEHSDRALRAISAIASLVTVHSDIGGVAENMVQVDADARPHLILTPSGRGLRVQMMVKPLADGGAYYRPGAGGESVIAVASGQRVQARRDLKHERKLAEEIAKACPALATEEDEWLLGDPEECLELLDQIRELGDRAVVEWPAGQAFRLARRVSASNMSVTISSGKNWFEAEGQIEIDDKRVLSLRTLLELLDESPGRFVRIDDGAYISMTREFRRRLDDLRAVTQDHGGKLQIHPLAAPGVEDLLQDVSVDSLPKAWRAKVEQFRQAEHIEAAVPSTLRADLRTYQVDGFKWMARLAHWGAGACLADDMGLGKTLQGLAFILHQSAEGPSIVVAPTSVCTNWIDEARKFAPTLNPILFGAGDRRAVLANLGPHDLLVCSYGLLYQEEEILTAVKWRVAILDEAQAIKNVATRRSKAAMNLEAEARAITTGTPIENHLGELWTLFRFINPGLLGTLEQFNRKFATPIEKNGDPTARMRLKRLIQPFILRRTKEQVLDELPARTEILLHVEFTAEEAAFYEALRQRSVEKLQSSNATPGQRRIQILAEIMRLRRACCNPKLVDGGLGISSAKLRVFLELVEELIENRHKALVFSQFVDHLTILREALDQKGVRYQYLDGATTIKQRKQRIDAFQAGEGDLFLISLKAGGLGLNLTAADYVIHMDPWWNPAAEDQASDRAHRIGQLRPVTIYRLVTKGTIEDKIVDLHARKRDLADSLLEGTDISAKVSSEELLDLLRSGMG